MRQSSRMTSTPSPRSRNARADGPSAKVVTENPSSTRLRLRDSRNSSSSSMSRIRTCGAFGICLVGSDEFGKATLSGELICTMGIHLVVQRAHDLALQVEIEIDRQIAV